MRIIAGRLRRRPLQAPKGSRTRPITDRAKEQLFENLGGELHGERVADVFSGSGTIGLEALSRGASSVVFFERDRAAFEALRANIDYLKVPDETLCWKTDILRTSFAPKNADQFFPYDLIFFDPPYKMVPELAPQSQLGKALVRLARPSVSASGASLVFRTPRRARFEMPDVWELDWELPISDMMITVYRRKDQEDDGELNASDAEALHETDVPASEEE